MLVIRLSRTGRKKQPYYRVVVAEKTAPIKGQFVEVLGHYNPRTKDLVIDVDKAKTRLANGAQPSETAAMLLEKAGALTRDKITEQNRRPTRQARKQEEAEAPKAKAEESTEAPADDAAAGDEATTTDASAEPTKEDPKDAPAEEAKGDEQPNDESADTTENKPEEPAESASEDKGE